MRVGLMFNIDVFVYRNNNYNYHLQHKNNRLIIVKVKNDFTTHIANLIQHEKRTKRKQCNRLIIIFINECIVLCY